MNRFFPPTISSSNDIIQNEESQSELSENEYEEEESSSHANSTYANRGITPNMGLKESIKSQVNVWLQNEESMKQLKVQLNTLRQRQKQVSSQLFGLLNNAKLDRVSLSSGGSIVPIQTTVHKAHTRESLMLLLQEKVFLGEPDKEIKASQLTKLIYDSRPTAVKTKIERKKK